MANNRDDHIGNDPDNELEDARDDDIEDDRDDDPVDDRDDDPDITTQLWSLYSPKMTIFVIIFPVALAVTLVENTEMNEREREIAKTA